MATSYSSPSSNFHPSKFSIDGIDHNNGEMYIQATKARMFRDDHTLNKILSVKSTGEMNALGARVNKFNPEIWERSIMDIVTKCLHTKFSQNKEISDCLLATGEHILVEASPSDKLWEIGHSMFDPMVINKQTHWCKNVQGKALMKICKTIREASNSQNTQSSQCNASWKCCSQVAIRQPTSPKLTTYFL